MKFYNLSKLLLFFAIINSLHLFADSYPLNAILIINQGSDYIKLKEVAHSVTATSLQEAIKSESAIIVTPTNVFAPFSKLSEKFINNFSFYKTITNDLIVAIPQKYPGFNKENLSAIGLNEQVLQYLPPEDFRNFLKEKKQFFDDFIAKNPQKQTIEVFNLDHLMSIFINSEARKRFFLAGHGLYSSVLVSEYKKEVTAPKKTHIAGLSLTEYKKFLVFLNTVGTDFLFVRSCYAGGYNLLQGFQKIDEKETITIPLNYFVAIQATTDATIASRERNFKTFFEKLNIFLSPEGPKNKNPLQELFKAENPKIEQIPSVRFPGSLNYFKAVDIDNKIQIITYATATARYLEYTSKKINAWNIDNKKVILLYPLEIKVPLVLKPVTPIISMIPGHSLHLFKEISCTTENIRGFVNKSFFSLKTPTEQLFFIEKLSIQRDPSLTLPGIVTDVVIQKKPLSLGGKIILTAGSNFYEAEFNETTLDSFTFLQIDEQSAKEEITEMINKIKVNPKAIKQASGGQESLNELKAKIIEQFTK